MHALIFWGFLDPAHHDPRGHGRADRSRPSSCPRSAAPTGWAWSRTCSRPASWSGSRSRSASALFQRPERFVGSHRWEAYRILGLIFLIIVTLFLARGARIAAGLRAGHLVDARVDGRVVPVHLDVRGVAAGFDVDLPVGPRGDHPGVPRLPRVLQAPAHRHERDQRLLREHPASGRLSRCGSISRAPRPRTCIWARPRSRTSPGSRRSTCTRAPSAGAARARARHGTRASRSRPSSSVMNLRDHLFEEGPTDPGGQGRGHRARAGPSCRDRRRGGPVGLHDVRRLHAGVPRRHRARRHDRRPAPEPGDGGVAVPDRGRARCSATSRAPANPWGMPQAQRADWAEGSDVRRDRGAARRPPSTCTGSGARARSTTARPRSRRRSPAAHSGQACPSRSSGPRELCTGDPARRMGNEYLFQTLARAERRRPCRGRGHEGHRELPALLQHARATSTPTTAGRFEVIHHSQLFARLVARRRAPARPARRPPRSRTTTRATSGATTASTATRALR